MCPLDASVGEARAALSRTGGRAVIVVNAERVVLGIVGDDALDGEGDDGRAVVDVMSEGPTTVRANEQLDALLERMRGAEVDAVLVTTPDGRLVGRLEAGRGAHYLHEHAAAGG